MAEEEVEVEEEEARVAVVAEDVVTTTTEMTMGKAKVEAIEEVAVNDKISVARERPSRTDSSAYSNRTLQPRLKSSSHLPRRFPKSSSNQSTTWPSL